MLKTIKIIVLAALCLNFSANAQVNKAIDVTTKGLQIGQEVSNVTITNLHNYKDVKGKPASTARLSDFKGKLLILDFWATWCSPCVAMIPKMDSLQKQFGNKIQFLSVTYQNQKEVLPFLEKYEKQKGKHYDLPLITEDKELHKLFPHVYLPHYVWIDRNGIIKAITGHQEILSNNINNVIEGKNLDMRDKKDITIAFDKNKPFLIQNNGGDGNNLLYHSVLTKYTPGLPGAYSFDAANPNSLVNRKLTVTNLDLRMLFSLAYGAGKQYFQMNNTVLQVTDDQPFNSRGKRGTAFKAWAEEYKYCYELILPRCNVETLFKTMQADLKRLFLKYSASVETKNIPCLALVRISNLDKIKTAGGAEEVNINGLGCVLRNTTLDQLVMKLNVIYMQKSERPLVNETAYTGKVDLSLNTSFSDLVEVNRELNPYDLAIKEKQSNVPVLIISNIQ